MKTRCFRPALIAGHAALTMVALAAMKVGLPATPSVHWQSAGQTSGWIAESPRRLPASRRAERTLTEYTLAE